MNQEEDKGEECEESNKGGKRKGNKEEREEKKGRECEEEKEKQNDAEVGKEMRAYEYGMGKRENGKPRRDLGTEEEKKGKKEKGKEE